MTLHATGCYSQAWVEGVEGAGILGLEVTDSKGLGFRASAGLASGLSALVLGCLRVKHV